MFTEPVNVGRVEPLTNALQAQTDRDLGDVAPGNVPVEGSPADPQQLGRLIGREEIGLGHIPPS